MDQGIVKANMNGRKEKKWIVLYLIGVLILVICSQIPLGKSVKDNKSVSVDLISNDTAEVGEVSTRSYAESYTLAVSEDIQINSVQVKYCAKDENFKGIITASLFDGDKLIDRYTQNIAAAGSDEAPAAASIAFDVDAQLQGEHEYALSLQIDTNLPDYSLQRSTSSDFQDTSGVIQIGSDGDYVISNLTYTPISVMRYWDAFYGFILLAVFLGGAVLLKVFGVDILKRIKGRKTVAFIQEHYNEILLILIFLLLAVYEIYFGYVKDTCISPDSRTYLTEANALLRGYGFNRAGEAGYYEWFSVFPIGYPAMIAAVAFVTGKNIYLSSKLLSILLAGLFLLFLYIRFRKDAWIYSLCLFNAGFLYIYKTTWSENPFILGLLFFCLILEYIVKHENVSKYWYVMWGLSSAFLFLCRYFGAFSVFIIGVVFIAYVCKYFITKRQNKNYKFKIWGSFLSGSVASLVIVSVFMMNYIHTGTISGVDRSRWWDDYSALTNALFNALDKELASLFHVVLPDTLAVITRHFQVWIVVLFLLILFYLLKKNKNIDFKFIFICVGLFYFAVFTFIRYNSSMDTFSYRFFAPASILITIGLLGFLVDFLNRHKMRIAPVAILTLILFIAGLSNNIIVNYTNTAYSNLCDTLKYSVRDVPAQSVVLGAKELDYRLMIFRPDVFYADGLINPGDTMDDLFARYDRSDYICVKAKHIKDILNYPVYDYDKSVTDFFAGVTEDTPNEEFVVISVKDREILEQ